MTILYNSVVVCYTDYGEIDLADWQDEIEIIIL